MLSFIKRQNDFKFIIFYTILTSIGIFGPSLLELISDEFIILVIIIVVTINIIPWIVLFIHSYNIRVIIKDIPTLTFRKYFFTLLGGSILIAFTISPFALALFF